MNEVLRLFCFVGGGEFGAFGLVKVVEDREVRWVLFLLKWGL